MKLSEKLSKYFGFSMAFFPSKLNFEVVKTKNQSHSLYISEFINSEKRVDLNT